MRIDNSQNINFTALIVPENKMLSKNPLVRYAINNLKHHCGGSNVLCQTCLHEADNHIMVSAKYFPKPNSRNIYCYNFSKRLDLESKEKVAEQIKQISIWLKKMRGEK